MDEDREGQRGFTVKDRRRFSETGETRPDAPAEAQPAGAATPSDAAPREEASAAPPPPRPEPAAAGAREAVTFSTFILGLSTQALLHLGEIPNPVTKVVERNLDAARQVIDILGILQNKTRNNLDSSEQSLLESVLYDLRMRFVELRRADVKGGR